MQKYIKILKIRNERTKKMLLWVLTIADSSICLLKEIVKMLAIEHLHDFLYFLFYDPLCGLLCCLLIEHVAVILDLGFAS